MKLETKLIGDRSDCRPRALADNQTNRNRQRR